MKVKPSHKWGSSSAENSLDGNIIKLVTFLRLSYERERSVTQSCECVAYNMYLLLSIEVLVTRNWNQHKVYVIKWIELKSIIRLAC